MTYRTGNIVPNTLYEDDVFIGSAISGHKASELVRLANLGAETELRLSGTVPYPTGADSAAIPDGGE